MLVKVNVGKEETYINIDLNEIDQIGIAHTGEGKRYIRGAQTYFTLKNGKKYLLNPAEAQKIVDAMRQEENNQ